MNDELIEEMITKIASEYIDMPEDKVLAELKNAGFAQEDIEDIMATIAEVKTAEQGDSAPEPDEQAQAEQMADEDDTPVNVTETATDTDNDGDADKKEVKAEKVEPEDDDAKNPSEEHSKEEDEPNDSGLEFTPDEVKSALNNAANSTHVGNLADTIFGFSGPGRK